MKKPVKQSRSSFVWSEVVDYIKEKHGKDVRDWAGWSRWTAGAQIIRYRNLTQFAENAGLDPDRLRNLPKSGLNAVEHGVVLDAGAASNQEINEQIGECPDYQDFWHWVVDNCDVHNGGTFTLDRDSAEDDDAWVQEILGIIFEEFAEEGEDHLEFYVSW